MKTYLIKAIKSRRFDKQISFIRQSIIEPPVVKEYPDQVVLKQHFTDKKHYKYIGKLISPVLKAQLNPNAHPLNIKGFEDIVQNLSSKEISQFLQSQRRNSQSCQKSKTNNLSIPSKIKNKLSISISTKNQKQENNKIENSTDLCGKIDAQMDINVLNISPIKSFKQDHEAPRIPDGIRKTSVVSKNRDLNNEAFIWASPKESQTSSNVFCNFFLLTYSSS